MASSSSEYKSNPQVVAIVLDLDNDAWRKVHVANDETFNTSLIVQSLLVFMNAVIMIQRENEISMFVYMPDGNAKLVAIQDGRPTIDGILQKVTQGLRSCIPGDREKWGLPTALLKTLCWLNKVSEESQQKYDVKPDCRILVVNASPDDASYYVPCMNVAFGAQKQNIIIDVCDFAQENSTILQQLAHLTGGVLQHAKSDNSAGKFTQMLLSIYLPNRATREFLRLPPPAPIVLQAVCVCHGQLRDRGFVCSVCLSVLCKEPSALCPTCQTRKASVLNM